jgi:acyl CoA:acetate/3-ketoacid CoA transferase beta subunit
MNYSSAELMIINAARLLRDGDVVFVGVATPSALIRAQVNMRTVSARNG